VGWHQRISMRSGPRWPGRPVSAELRSVRAGGIGSNRRDEPLPEGLED
jgi:hypothetical protein